MSIIGKIYYFFSRYTGSEERKVGRFFAGINERDAPHKIETSLRKLLQNDIAVINLWTEHRYKGYDYLTKASRKQLYENLSLIKQDFESYAATQTVDAKRIIEHIGSKGVDTAPLWTMQDRLSYLMIIMSYLSPSKGTYVYRESSSFGRLLRDPANEKLEGDCNQIVTLYIALYSLKYDITDLKLTLFPGHVALHFQGVDVETTSGQFAHYKREGQTLASIHEIVSINLLDTTDINFTKSSINPEIFLQAARLAYVVSSNRGLVKRNLESAYQNTVRHLLQQQQFTQALEYARQSADHELIEISAQKGAIYATKQYDFSGARRFASHSQRKHELDKLITQDEAAYLFNSKKYEQAAKLYERLGDADMAKQSYRGAYGEEQQKLKGAKSVADIKAHAGTVRTMQRLARASGDAGLRNHADGLAKYL